MEQCKHRDVGTKYNYLKADYTCITSELNKIHWDILLSNESIDANWNLLKSTVLAIVIKYVPKVEVTKKHISNKPLWWSTQISKAVKEKQYLYSQYTFTRSDADYASYALKRNQVKSLITTAKAKYDELLIHNFTCNPKALYGYIRDKSKVKASISQIIKSDGSVTNDDHEVVEVFNGFFQSVFIKDDPFLFLWSYLKFFVHCMRLV